mgnify:CR=1 FL=1
MSKSQQEEHDLSMEAIGAGCIFLAFVCFVRLFY